MQRYEDNALIDALLEADQGWQFKRLHEINHLSQRYEKYLRAPRARVILTAGIEANGFLTVEICKEQVSSRGGTYGGIYVPKGCRQKHQIHIYGRPWCCGAHEKCKRRPGRTKTVPPSATPVPHHRNPTLPVVDGELSEVCSELGSEDGETFETDSDPHSSDGKDNDHHNDGEAHGGWQ